MSDIFAADTKKTFLILQHYGLNYV